MTGRTESVRAEAIGFRHEGGDWVFRDYGFALDEGEILAVLGPNGRGKTTLIKCALGMWRPSAGSVRLGASAGYVPQAGGSAFPYRVLDMVVMGRARHLGLFRAPGREDFRIARGALDRLGCGALAERRTNELSGGERQMVMIARALASECRILMLDEPTSALDFRHQKTLLHGLKDLARQGMTIVFSTHVPQHAQEAADKVLLMQGPESYDFGPREQVMTEANLARLYGVPVRAVDLDHDGRPLRSVVPIFA